MTELDPAPNPEPAARSVSRMTWLDRNAVSVLLMVTIAVLGANASYRMARAEQRAVNLERRLFSGQLQDISFQQQLAAEMSTSEQLQLLRAQVGNEARELDAATRAASGSVGSADLEGLQAAELRMQTNVLWTFISGLRGYEGKTPLLQDIANQSVEYLQGQGYEARAIQDGERWKVEFPRLHDAVHKAHDVVPWLAFCVLLYVCGLVCLTLAEFDSTAARRGWLVGVLAGAAFSLVATVTVLVLDPGALASIVTIGLLLGGWIWLGNRKGTLFRDGDSPHKPHPDLPEPAHVPFNEMAAIEGNDNWSRRIVLLITTAVLMTSVFLMLYSHCLRNSGHYALESQDAHTLLVDQRTQLSARALAGGLGAAIELIQARMDCAAATQTALLGADGALQANGVALEARRSERCKNLERLTREYGALPGILDTRDMFDSVATPARAILNEQTDRSGGPNEVVALADGYSELSVGWHHRAALLLAVLTVLAMALYLFVQAYRLGGTPSGRWLIRSGGALLVISVVLGVYGYTRPVALSGSNLPQSCAAQGLKSGDSESLIKYVAKTYAAGITQYDQASLLPAGSPEQAHGYETALNSFNCAKLARPGFIPAYGQYVATVTRLDAKQFYAPYYNFDTRTRLPELHDAQLAQLKALEHTGLAAPPAMLNGFAFLATVMALGDGNAESLGEARLALDALNQDQIPWWRAFYIRHFRPQFWTNEEEPNYSVMRRFNLGLTQLATGDARQLKAADSTYDRALAANWTPQLLAATLSDLEALTSEYCGNLHKSGDACQRIASAVNRLRGRVANGMPASAAPMHSDARVADFAADLTPYSASWQLRVANFDPQRDRLAVVWFKDERRQPGEQPDPAKWQLRYAIQELFRGYYPKGPQLPTPDASGLIRLTSNSLKTTYSCLPPGRYVAELFLNGSLAGTVTAQVAAKDDLRIYESRELDVEWCIPRGWSAWGLNLNEHPWMADKPVRGFVLVTPDNKQDAGGFLTAFYAPPSMPAAQRETYFLHRMIQILLRKGDNGSGWTQAYEDQLVAHSTSFDRLSAAQCSSDERVGLVYRYFRRASAPNVVHVAFMNGDLPGREICTYLRSLEPYYEDGWQ